MAHIQRVQINIYFRHKKNGKSITTSTNLVSTEEVLQMTNFSNDNTRLQQLANETGHTYLKTPAGLFTQLTIPMSDIMAGHRMILLILLKLFYTGRIILQNLPIILTFQRIS